MIKLKDLLKEETNQSIISGKEFKRKYLTTNSNKLEKAYFADENGSEVESMGSVLGDGSYYSVTQDSSNHYESDDYYDSTDYFDLSDSAKIMIIPDAQTIGGTKVKQMAKAHKADGVYDPTEGKDNNPYLGLVIYNNNMVK